MSAPIEIPGFRIYLSADKSVARAGDVVTFYVKTYPPQRNTLIDILIRLEVGPPPARAPLVVTYLTLGYTNDRGECELKWEVPENILATFPRQKLYNLVSKTWEIYAYSPPNNFSNIIKITVLPRGAPLPTPTIPTPISIAPVPTAPTPTPIAPTIEALTPLTTTFTLFALVLGVMSMLKALR